MSTRFLVALLLLAGPTMAQQSGAPMPEPAAKPAAAAGRQPLRGLHAIDIEVEDVGSLGASCGVNASDLKQTAARPLLDDNLTVDNRSLTPYVYVNVHVVKVNTTCVAAVSVSVRDPGLVLITYQQTQPSTPTTNSAPEILLWEKESVLAGAADAFGARVNAEVRDSVVQFVTEVKQQNPPQ